MVTILVVHASSTNSNQARLETLIMRSLSSLPSVILDVFARPSVSTARPYHLALAIAIPTLFFAYLGFQIFSFAISSFLGSPLTFWVRKAASQTAIGQQNKRKSNDQVFRILHALLVASTTALIVTIACMLKLSSLPDADTSRKC